ncbi:hypothetical protein ACIBI9_29650 [Nonomuraea sp. NPDC050451]|uniref:hypothetical protein n=1 Tax=Nonomuraea sp. NPDC050451 TaxID=3364364 RepID=UPI00378AD4CF
MAYPPQPHPQDPWGPQPRGAHSRPDYGRPPYGQPAPQPGHEPRVTRQGPDPHPWQGGPPWSPGPQTQYIQDDLYALPLAQDEYALPPSRNRTLVIGLSAGLGVLLVGAAIGAVTYFNSSGSKPTIALPGTSFPTTAPRQSAPPSEAPTTPSPSSRAQAGSPIADSEFDDWKFNLSGVKFDANKVDGWTYDTCDPVDGQGVLAKNDCERAVQVAYSAYRGHLKAVQVMMSFPTDKAARTTATRLAKLTSDAMNIRSDMVLPTYAYGKIRTNPAKKYVVVTIVTADKSARSKAAKFHLYLQAHSVSHLLLRDVIVTS